MEADANYSEAIVRFQELFSRASEGGMREPAAMSLATVDQDGGPSIRIVLLRKIDERGFVFFTNSQSRKGQQLATNPQAALCFHYDSLGEQVRVEGNTEKNRRLGIRCLLDLTSARKPDWSVGFSAVRITR